MIFKKLFLFIIFALIFPTPIFAQSEKPLTYQAEIIKIIEEKPIEVFGKIQTYQKLELKILDQDKKGQSIEIETGTLPLVNVPYYRQGDKVLISQTQTPQGSQYFIEDFVRTDPLLALFLLFLILTLIIARKKGILSIFGMIISFLFIFYLILPQIAAGANPIFISLLSALFLIPLTFFLSHGFNCKTLSAIIATLISLFFTSLLALLFISQSNLTGYSTEEAGFLSFQNPNQINMINLLLAGIIIGLLGILDDITIAQSAIVFTLKKENPKQTFKSLYTKSMQIGRDHISSMVNTLIIVYTASSLPLFLLFLDSSKTFVQAINYEPITEEIIKMLISSISLILAVPLTTFIACFNSRNIKSE